MFDLLGELQIYGSVLATIQWLNYLYHCVVGVLLCRCSYELTHRCSFVFPSSLSHKKKHLLWVQSYSTKVQHNCLKQAARRVDAFASVADVLAYGGGARDYTG